MKTAIETNLILARKNQREKLRHMFNGKAIESHIFGSLARQRADAFSDIDVWFTFKDEDFDEIYNKRFEYYENLGDIVHFCEAPQNAPTKGVHTALLIRSAKNVVVVVDIYLCPLSTAYITEEGKKVFGINLPFGEMGLNPKKVTVDKDYRIDFFFFVILTSIKKLARHEQAPLEVLLREYEYLHQKYHIEVQELHSKEQVTSTLENIIDNIQKVSNDKQNKALRVIRDFASRVLI